MNGTGWVFGALLGILAIALVIAGATGHASQLFTGITGKATGSTAAGVGPINPVPTSGGILSADQAITTALAQIGAGAPASSSSPSGSSSLNPYAGLGPATTTSPAGAV